jgi:hypothetical protein
MKASPLRYAIVYTALLLLSLWLLHEGRAWQAEGTTAATINEELMGNSSDNDVANDGSNTEGAATGSSTQAYAVFAGGCFWCMEPPYDKLEGVIETVSGYAGGHTENPGYYDVVGGGTGHAEVVKVVYDPAQISYAELLDVFWNNIDPTTLDRQFCDVGDQYRTAIFYVKDQQEP